MLRTQWREDIGGLERLTSGIANPIATKMKEETENENLTKFFEGEQEQRLINAAIQKEPTDTWAGLVAAAKTGGWKALGEKLKKAKPQGNSPVVPPTNTQDLLSTTKPKEQQTKVENNSIWKDIMNPIDTNDFDPFNKKSYE